MFFAAVTTAAAHGEGEGTPGFVAGLLHPLFVIDHTLAVLAAAMLQGQHLGGHLRRQILIFAAALLLGLSVSIVIPPSYYAFLVLLSLTIAAALLVALARPLPLALVTGLAALIGLLVGFDSGVSTGSWSITLVTLLGTAVTILAINALITAAVARIHDGWPRWTKIAVRIIASWVAAITALILSLQLFG